MSDTNLNDASFTPEINDSEESTNKQTYSATGSFRFWCQKVLPLVYDDSLSYYELLCKVVNYLNNVIQNVDNLNTSVDNTNTAFDNLQNYVNTTKDTLVEVYGELEQYVNDYFNNLDIQEEINSKLDSMAEDGSLSTIILPIITSAVSEWLRNNITPTSPAIDASLSVSGAGADAKVTGDRFSEINEYFQQYINITPSIATTEILPDANLVDSNKSYTFVATDSSTPANLPTDIKTGEYYTLITSKSGSTMSGGSVQFLVNSDNNIWLRYKKNVTEWFDWFNLKTVFATEIKEDFNNYIKITPSFATTEILPDANLVSTNSSYTFVATDSSTPANLPTDIKTGEYYTLITSKSGSTMSGGSVQFLVNSDNNVWLRYKRNVTDWLDWFNLKSVFTTEIIEGMIKNIPSFTDATTLSDANNAPDNSILHMVLSNTYRPSNLPTDAKTGEYTTLMTIKAGTGNGSAQFFFNGANQLYFRVKEGGSYAKWMLPNNRVFVVAKDGSGDFTSFTRAVRALRVYDHSTIYVKEGTYDLEAEMIDVYPSYFSNYAATDLSIFPDNRGLALGWGMKIICSPNAKFICNRTTDDNATASYSPIYAANSDFELINFNLECSLVRYGIHDDPYKDDDPTYKAPRWRHIYKNCNIKVDNSQSSKRFRACIGGGYGKQSSILIEDCIFESVGVSANEGIVGFHNCELDNSKSQAVIRGCYFKTGTCYTTWYGASTDVSVMLASNNRFKSEALVHAESSQYTNVNVELLNWNNVIE